MEQKRWIKITIIFFCLTIIFTIVSRGVTNLSKAKITVQAPKGGKISRNLTYEANVTSNISDYIMVPANLFVSDILVSENDEVNVGTPIFSVDRTTLDKDIEKLSKEVQAKNDTKNRTISRATEDYNKAVGEANQKANNLYNEIQNAQQSLNDYLSTHDSKTTPTYNDDVKTMQDEIDQKIQAYNEQAQSKDETIESAKRALEDAKNDNDAKDTGSEDEEKLASLNQIKSQDYKFLADRKGAVNKLQIQAGEKTTEGSYVVLSNNDSANKVDITISKDDSLKINKKSVISLTYDNAEGEYVEEEALGYKISNADLKSTDIDSQEKNNKDLKKLTITLKSKAKIGTQVSVEIKNKSKDYNCVVPIECLHQSSPKEYFIYVARKTKTVMGKELVAKKINVKVLDKNATMAAISDENINYDEKIIKKTNKPITNNSKVEIAK